MTFSPVIELSSLDGTNGFAINGIAAYDGSGFSVSSAGDVNGDGIGDVIIGAYFADPNGSNSGQSYVVFGSKSGFSPSLNLSTLNGSNGFTINGISAGDFSGRSVSNAGDVNGDGIDDLIIGANGADPNGVDSVGQSYVVFGSKGGFGASFNPSTLNGSNGFAINGIAAGDNSGISVSSAGDVNGDGTGDLIIGATGADPNGVFQSGQSYVVFGSNSGFGASLNLSTLNGSNGFAINGITGNDDSARSVSSAGDVNGDGISDVIIGARNAAPNGSQSGQSYVVFGSKSGFSPSLNLSTLNGSNGFTINGTAAGDSSGLSVSNAGDVNGDGIDDLIIGASFADPNGLGDAGQSYVVFGSKSGFGASLNLVTLNGSNGFAINGIAASDRSGNSVSNAGDVNGDGIGDVIIGAWLADPNSISNAGQSYVIFGKSSNQPPVAVNDAVSTNEDTLLTGNVLAANPTTPDSDPNNDPLTVTEINGNAANVGTSVTLTSGALLNVSATGNFTYNPNGKFESLGTGAKATDSFTYTISDGKGGTSSATATVTINGVNDAALISGTTTAAVTEDTSSPNLTASGNLTIIDVDTGESKFNTSVTKAGGNLGSLTLTEAGAFNYSVANSAVQFLGGGQTQIDTFTVKSFDGSTSQNITVTINGANDAPVAVNDSATTNQNKLINLPVTVLLANDTDVDSGSVLSITAVSGAVGGTATLNNNGTTTISSDDFIVFSPNNNFTGNASFKYTVSDGSLTSTATVTVNVTAVASKSLVGTPGNDSLTGGAANDRVEALGGDDTVFGGGGNDFLEGGAGNDSLDGGTGNDRIESGTGNDTVIGGDGSEWIEGESGNDLLYGDGLMGVGTGNDTINGGTGNDTLIGGAGINQISGGEGKDVFVIGAAGGLSGKSTVIDFLKGTDVIGLANGLTFSQLTFSGSNIVFGAETLVLINVDTKSLTAANFVSVSV